VKRTISLAIASASTAAATAAALWLAVPAGAATRTAVSGPEHFQLMSTSATSNTASVIASGVFTAGGVDHMGNKVDTLVFSNGSFKVAHSKGTGTPKLNPKTCLFTLNLHGTIALSGGTGAYKGISGKGTYQLNELAILARSGGKCTMKKPPTSVQVLIKATASVKL
jgi:hypothetical protein